MRCTVSKRSPLFNIAHLQRPLQLVVEGSAARLQEVLPWSLQLTSLSGVRLAGGAWTIGYKAWGALLAKRLSQAGALVACLDYRNFPQVRFPTSCHPPGDAAAHAMNTYR